MPCAQQRTPSPSLPNPTKKLNIKLGVIVQRFHIVLNLGNYRPPHGWIENSLLIDRLVEPKSNPPLGHSHVDSAADGREDCELAEGNTEDLQG